MEMKFCQSCAMPLNTKEDHGTNADGSLNEDYCKYCYENGKFTSDDTMESMIKTCAKFMVEGGHSQSEEQATKEMMEYFPKLKRWAKS